MEKLRLRPYGRLTPAEPGDALLSVSVGPAGEAVALWSAPDDREALTSLSSETSPDARAARPAGVRITVHTPDLTTVVRIASMPLAHVTAQPLPGGRFLVVAARCRLRPEGPDRNAIVYDPDGTPVAEFTFGDGIEEVLTTPTGQAWAGYFDEGVYGNYGWDDPLGSCGLIRWNTADGEQAWRFRGGDAPYIDDCYALNVTDETAWACYYSDFPLVRIHDGKLTVWRNKLARGARALIVDDSRVALFGGYSPDHDAVAVGKLGNGKLRAAGRYRLTLPDGTPLPDRYRFTGRGPTLNFFHGTDWHQLTLADIA
ncbi:hypothetical protein JIG36_03805 [Actinoplanes sp. LDG1-06]|uniref:Uncharacterized protein n=1 Tax=Paractinoplanes ovalisporus TaxID=2810368 RepID=A0ABS2A4C1_9ACTN|nr:hypothetical protein [Actinoplanes ovalisporus]MBM2614679.1 hypothetical protein [Actinoplanes ovalisporus]